MKRYCICADCDCTSEMDSHGACVNCGSLSVLVIKSDIITRNLRLVQETNQRARNPIGESNIRSFSRDLRRVR